MSNSIKNSDVVWESWSEIALLMNISWMARLLSDRNLTLLLIACGKSSSVVFSPLIKQQFSVLTKSKMAL